MKSKYPIVLCREVPPSHPRGVKTWEFWCPFCSRYHTHGAEPGHRVAHCGDESSPFYEKGYVLKKEAKR